MGTWITSEFGCKQRGHLDEFAKYSSGYYEPICPQRLSCKEEWHCHQQATYVWAMGPVNMRTNKENITTGKHLSWFIFMKIVVPLAAGKKWSRRPRSTVLN